MGFANRLTSIVAVVLVATLVIPSPYSMSSLFVQSSSSQSSESSPLQSALSQIHDLSPVTKVLPLISSIPSAYAEALGSWSATSSYPVFNFAEGSCNVSSGYVYCVASGFSNDVINAVNYAQLSSGGVGSWSSTTSYPIATGYNSCVISGTQIYCVGGNLGGPFVGGSIGAETTGGYTNAAYYSTVSSSGVGTWTATTNYPTTTGGQSCVTSSGYIYCVGGTADNGNTATNAVYYAPLSSSGIGSWTSTTVYPIPAFGLSCATTSGYIYCVGGQTGGSAYSNSVYYAPLSSGGVGPWSSTSNYPLALYDESCVISSGYIYCVGGGNGSVLFNAVNYASVSSSGVGSWTSTSSYPINAQNERCVTSSGDIYCVGGQSNTPPTGQVYYASIAAPSLTSTTTTLSSSVNPSVFGQSVTFTATVAPVPPGTGTPTGTIQFAVDGTNFGSPVSLSGGSATSSSISSLSVGSHTITASYSPSSGSDFAGSSGTLSQTVNKADTTTSVTSSANPSVFGQSVIFTATVSPVAPGAGTPTGTVTFYDGATPLGTGTLSGGTATLSTSSLSAGSHTMTVSYGGDGNFNTSTSTGLTQTVTYKFGGFLPPVTDGGTYNGGRTLPVKFQLFDVNNNLMTTATATIFVDGNPASGNGANSVGNTVGFDGQQYHYDLSTKGLANGAHTVRVHLDDGTDHSFGIVLK